MTKMYRCRYLAHGLYIHYDCFITLPRYQFSGVYCVNAYDKEDNDDK